MLTVASDPPLIPFLQEEPFMFRVPLPERLRVEPDLTLIAAPSKSELVSSVEASSLSVSVDVPERLIVALLPFLITTGAVLEEESERLSKIRVTPVTPLSTTMLPSLQLPVTL